VAPEVYVCRCHNIAVKTSLSVGSTTP